MSYPIDHSCLRNNGLMSYSRSLNRTVIIYGSMIEMAGIQQSPSTVLISLSNWSEQIGISPSTAWRWRKMGWIKTVNIAGRQYLTTKSLKEFEERANRGEFSRERKLPNPPDESH